MSELEQIKKAESRESKVTVLAIDDEADFLEFVGEAMSSENVEFLSTTDPEEGLTIVQKRHPPVILLDLNMPKAPDRCRSSNSMSRNSQNDAACSTSRSLSSRPSSDRM